MSSIYERVTRQYVAQDQIAAYLHREGIHFEKWDADFTPAFVNEKIAFSEVEKQQLLAIYEDQIVEFAQKRGYTKWDIAVLSVETPDMLQKFGDVHYHKEDEVRIVVGGKGVFIIKSLHGDHYFELGVSIGDVVVVPQERYHAFKLANERKFAVVRLFSGEVGSVTYPVTDLSFHVK
ncbi:acireductone dioxygenase [Paenibacillus marchantiophytorum]|uniref:acireductone dioxygenase (Fe(2+)-requiring) n=1 Tax=Paenibacillus marchantiophytorum TaxID=1619310 RepID=A0ABQ2BQT8_9BACL|nr:cupin domain-containing protein [Paenibacillus marchantiophytorum]GGI43852.1 acireductone dioxygenase [Paenibacillus marchantiophytorum]